MYKAKCGSQIFDIVLSDQEILINGKPFSWDLVKIDHKEFHIIHKHKSYRAFIVEEKDRKKIIVKINNSKYEVELQDKFDLLLEKMGMTNGSTGRVNSIKAPMPGLIIDLKVKEGDVVKLNDPLIVLEAMKMENIIKSSGEGTVKVVKVKKGQSVEKSQVLIEF